MLSIECRVQSGSFAVAGQQVSRASSLVFASLGGGAVVIVVSLEVRTAAKALGAISRALSLLSLLFVAIIILRTESVVSGIIMSLMAGESINELALP